METAGCMTAPSEHQTGMHMASRLGDFTRTVKKGATKDSISALLSCSACA